MAWQVIIGTEVRINRVTVRKDYDITIEFNADHVRIFNKIDLDGPIIMVL